MDDVGREFFSTFATTAFYQTVESVVAFIFHVVQTIVEFLSRQCSLYKRAEFSPQQHTYY